ncbi:MAG: RrF2 family transcriptional regulator [Catonella sp.]
MKISTKGRYGLRAVLDIAMHDEASSVSSIAARQFISENYLERLIAMLKKAGIVNSLRGAQGGYVLARSSEEISVGEVLRALEGDLNPVDCSELDGSGELCEGADTCVTKFVWKRISDSINQAVDNLMISELAKDGRHLLDENGCDRNISPVCNRK